MTNLYLRFRDAWWRVKAYTIMRAFVWVLQATDLPPAAQLRVYHAYKGEIDAHTADLKRCAAEIRSRTARRNKTE